MKNRKGIDSDRRGGREEFGGRGKINRNQDTSSEKKSLFNIRQYSVKT